MSASGEGDRAWAQEPGRLGNHWPGWLVWLWLLIGFLILPFAMIQTVVPLAAWLAPIFLLRFVRTSRRAGVALPLIFLAYAVAITIALRGSESGILAELILGLITFPPIRGILYTLPYAADRLVGSRLASWGRLLIFPLAFTSVDWLMSLSRVINSTGSPAYSQFGSLALMQLLSVTGMWGLTFLIMWCASTVNALWEHAFDWRPVRGALGAFVGVMLAVFLFGYARLAIAAPGGQAVEAATVTLDSAISSQASAAIVPGFNHLSQAQRLAARPQIQPAMDQLLARTETALREGAKIVSWQEGAGTVLEEDEPQALARAAALARQYDAYLQVSLGVVTRSPDQHFILNQSILIDNTGSVRWTYEKTYPVFPIESYVVVAGPGRLPVVDTPIGRLSTAICNDFHFTRLLHQAGQNRVDLMLAPYHDIHPYEWEDAVSASFRAVENGFSLVRPAGAGVSTIVDYEGRILARRDFFTDSTGIMLAKVPAQGVRTVYGFIGDSFAYLCVLGLLALLLLGILRPARGRAPAV